MDSAEEIIRNFDKQTEGPSQSVKKYVEQIVTGEFLKVTKDVDLGPICQDEVMEINKVSKFDTERELIRQQIVWIGRINALFTSMLGTCAGMSMMHMIFMLVPEDFLTIYGTYAVNINVIFLFVSNFALLLGITMASIYRQKSKEKVRSYDSNRHSYSQQYTVTFAVSAVIFVCTIIYFITPIYTIRIGYFKPSAVDASWVSTTKILYSVANVLMIFTFIGNQCAVQDAPSEEELEPESDDDGISTSDSEEEVDGDIGQRQDT